MHVLVLDPYVSESEASDAGCELVKDLHSSLSRADAVSLHTPLTDDTRELMDARAFQAMKPGSVLINTGAGRPGRRECPARRIALGSRQRGRTGYAAFGAPAPGPSAPAAGECRLQSPRCRHESGGSASDGDRDNNEHACGFGRQTDIRGRGEPTGATVEWTSHS